MQFELNCIGTAREAPDRYVVHALVSGDLFGRRLSVACELGGGLNPGAERQHQARRYDYIRRPTHSRRKAALAYRGDEARLPGRYATSAISTEPMPSIV
jgi:hypothetical protein